MILLQTKSHVIEALEKKRFFKLVCGASLTDAKMVENLAFIFSVAGAHVIDLAPTAEVIFAAKRGIERALNSQFSILNPPLLMASIQLDKDPHFRKVQVDYNLCDVCGACIEVCPTKAFTIELSASSSQLYLYKERCFGCGVCPSCCHVNALSMMDTKPTPKETLQEMHLLGIKAIEFHFGKNYLIIEKIWPEIKSLVNELELISFSIGSEILSEAEIKEAANLCCKLTNGDIILQCDGKPMSGGLQNGNNTDNSSLEVARIIQEEKLGVYLQLSGGTNQYSYMKAKSATININGVALGSYARKLLMPYLNFDLLENKELLSDAVKIARTLVKSVAY